MSKSIIHKGIVFVSKEIFDEAGISANSTKVVFRRKKLFQIVVENKTYLKYDSIPIDTRLKLPSKIDLLAECHLEKHDDKVDDHYINIYNAQTKGYIQHIEFFKAKYPLLPRKKINTASQLYAVWIYIIEKGGRDTRALYSAYNKVYTGRYKSYNSFANAKAESVKNGAESMAIDKRWFTTPENINKVNEVNQFWASCLIGIGKKYSNHNVWEKICLMGKEANEKAPSKGWVDKYRAKILKSNINIYESRNGIDDASGKQLTFASMQCALNANTQWQYDGWTLPFWVDGFKRYVIVIVKDAYSKKIIGSAVGQSENTLVIMAALRDAIMNTGYLPYEFLTDKHSWNKTIEAVNFRESITAVGAKYTVTSSPTHKSIIERFNQHLDTLCREYYGYIGEGVKSKNVNAHPKQELIDEYAKNSITDGEVKLIGIKIVRDFNDQLLRKEGKSPNQLYEESEKLYCFPVDLFERIKILTAKTEIKISRGQVNITRGNIKYSYQLPASFYSQYNNQIVIIRYEDLNESIYLYDKEKDTAIIELRQKPMIHGALADQTDEDITLLNKNKGRIEGIKSSAKKANEQLTKAALKLNPEAIVLLNKKTTPKNIIKEFEEDANLKRLALDKGINLNLVHVPERENEFDNGSLKCIVKSNESPFTPKNHKLKKISPKDFYE